MKLGAYLAAAALLASAFARPTPGMAAAGALDPTFGHAGFVVIPHVVYSVNDVEIDASGRVIVSVDFAGLGGGIGGFGVARLTPVGAPDPSFGAGGIAVATFSPLINAALSAAVQSDGKIIAVGASAREQPFGSSEIALARFNANGTLDATFGHGGSIAVLFPGSTQSAADSVALLSDGKFLIGGSGTFSLLPRSAVMRLNADGSVDTSFGHNGVALGAAHDPVNGIGLEAGGKIVALTGGSAFRLLAGGLPDGSAALGAVVSQSHIGLSTLMPDERIVAARGVPDTSSMLDEDTMLLRTFPSGALDATFNSPEFDFLAGPIDHFQNLPSSIALAPNGEVVTAGFGSNNNGSRFAVARFLPTGRFDTTFGRNGKTTSVLDGDDQAYAMALQPNGDIVVAGKSLITGDLVVARYLGR